MAAKTIKKRKEEVPATPGVLNLGDKVAIWYDKNQKYVFAGVGVLVVIALGIWAYQAHTASRERDAREAYAVVAGKMPAGETAPAESWKAVIPELREVVDQYGDTPAGLSASTLLGRAYLETGKPEEAAKLLAGLVNSASDHPALERLLRYQLATAYTRAGNEPDALAEWNRLAEQAETSVAREAHWHVARLLSAKGDHAGAVDQLEKALAIQGPLPPEVVLVQQLAEEKAQVAAAGDAGAAKNEG